MTECLNETMLDRLPMLAHGTLTAAEAAEVRAHIAGCAACAAELALLETSRLVLQANAPRVDAAAIARAVAARPALTVERGGASAAAPRRSAWRSRQWLAAAASVIVVVTLSMQLLGNAGSGEGPALGPDTTGVATGPGGTEGASAVGGVAVGEGLTDLTDADLSALLTEIESVEATVAAEPAAVRQPIVDTPENE